MQSEQQDWAPERAQQAAIDAARDPNNSLTAQQAENIILQEATAAGAAAAQFDPSAPPEEKAAQLRAQNTDQPELHQPHPVAALISDQDDGETAGYDLPAPTKAGAITRVTTNLNLQEEEAAAEAAKWERVGWAPRFGWPADPEDEDSMRDHQTLLEGKLDEKFFGDWYHNTAIIIFASLSTYISTLLGGGLAMCFIIMATCGTYYRTSIRRVRRNYRDDMVRELAKTRLETDVESLEWMNSFMAKFWPIIAPQICTAIVASVDQVLSTSTPAFLDSLRLKFFTLGTKPPRMEHVKTYPRQEDDVVIMDWRFSFTPNDTSDLTARQIKIKVNPKVILEVRIGKALLSKGLSVIVEDMACSGTMRIKCKLQLQYPYVERVEICFIGRPVIDYKCKPLGGETLGFDINFIPGLEKFILEQIHANLGPMMYDPNVFPIEIAQLLSGDPVGQAIGVLQITFHGAQGLRNPDKFSGAPDPYAVVTLNQRIQLGRTKTVRENANPRWNETVNVILTSLREPLAVQIFDYNTHRKDKELGVATLNLEPLEADSDQENMQLEIMSNGRPRGILQADIRYFPVLKGRKLPDGTDEPAPVTQTGIVRFTVEQAKDLDGTKSLIGQLNPYAVLLLNGKEVQVSQKLKRTNNPIWVDAYKELLITDRENAKLGLVIKDDRDISVDPILGSYQIKLDDILDLTSKGQEWYNLAGAGTGRAKMKVQWKPVALRGAMAGLGGYVTPIGVMRFHFVSGRELKNLDTVGKSDPYVRVLVSGIQKGRTVTWKNNLNPDWDEVVYVPVRSVAEKLVIEVMDEENTQKDRPLGALNIDIARYVRKQGNEYLAQDSRHELISDVLHIGNQPPKGTINFTAAFFPCVPTIDPAEEEREEGRRSVESNNAAYSAPPTPITAGPRANHRRSDTAGTIESLKSASGASAVERSIRNSTDQAAKEQQLEEVPEVVKTRITPDDLVNYECGLIIFKLHEGELTHPNTYLEVVMDDMSFPAYTSARSRTLHAQYNDTGDAIVRELDLSRMTLRLVSELNRKGDDKEDAIKAKITGSTLDFLKRSLYTPTVLVLKDKENRDSRVTVSTRFVPLQMQLDASESFNNAGSLRVEVLDAADLPAADRNGFSDPFCRFFLGGKEVHKTKTQKKTLNPSWNEAFEVSVRSRTAANFEVKVFDWDFGDKADFLGSATINLDILEPFSAQEIVLTLDGKSGTLRLKMLFKPDYVMRARHGSSTFSGTFNAPVKVIGAPVKGVGKGVSMVGGGVVRGASFLKSGFRKKDGSNVEDVGDVADIRDAQMNSTERPRTPVPTNGVADSLERNTTPTASAVTSHATASSTEAGTATISVLAAAGFEGDRKLEVHILQGTPKGPKKVLETDHVKPNKDGEIRYESSPKSIPCSLDQEFKVQILEHRRLGGDHVLGEASFAVNDPSGDQLEVTVGTGVVVLRTKFQAQDAASIYTATESPNNKKSSLGRFARRERGTTPG